MTMDMDARIIAIHASPRGAIPPSSLPHTHSSCVGAKCGAKPSRLNFRSYPQKRWCRQHSSAFIDVGCDAPHYPLLSIRFLLLCSISYAGSASWSYGALLRAGPRPLEPSSCTVCITQLMNAFSFSPTLSSLLLFSISTLSPSKTLDSAAERGSGTRFGTETRERGPPEADGGGRGETSSRSSKDSRSRGSALPVRGTPGADLQLPDWLSPTAPFDAPLDTRVATTVDYLLDAAAPAAGPVEGPITLETVRLVANDGTTLVCDSTAGPGRGCPAGGAVSGRVALARRRGARAAHRCRTMLRSP
eukprot:gene12863-8744_t